ncbi:hypothetical protein E2C01_051777 [Portunus trituberculatus]|uniref:Uncharacterized protein n=1 Tax=Portunus trituberculatus TaxID=210409 RepID=A0A5B7GJQ3_PORTR|nr:hypothetical protein [Portunus trituberculatus]
MILRGHRAPPGLSFTLVVPGGASALHAAPAIAYRHARPREMRLNTVVREGYQRVNSKGWCAWSAAIGARGQLFVSVTGQFGSKGRGGRVYYTRRSRIIYLPTYLSRVHPCVCC